MISSLHQLFLDQGVPAEDLWPKTLEYFNVDVPGRAPFNKISAMLWASIARKAANGQRRPPSRGTVVDIDVLSTLLPYCDAMLVDNECRAFLREEPLKSELRYKTKVFSMNSLNEFLAYLRELRAGIPDVHLDLVHEVYGEGWERPFLGMYDGDSGQGGEA